MHSAQTPAIVFNGQQTVYCCFLTGTNRFIYKSKTFDGQNTV